MLHTQATDASSVFGLPGLQEMEVLTWKALEQNSCPKVLTVSENDTKK